MRNRFELAAFAALALAGCSEGAPSSTGTRSDGLPNLTPEETRYAQLRIDWFDYDGMAQNCAEEVQSQGGNVDANCEGEFDAAAGAGIDLVNFEDSHQAVVTEFNRRFEDVVVKDRRTGRNVLAFQDRRSSLPQEN